MQSLEYLVEVYLDGEVGVTQPVRVQGERIEEDIAQSVTTLLDGEWAPRNHREWLVLTASGRPRCGGVLGLGTLPIRDRTLRRAADRLWSRGEPAPGPARLAAFRLLTDRRATIRWTPLGIQVSRY